MHQSVSSMAQLTLNTSFDATEIMALRARLKKKLNGEPFLVTLPEFFMDDMEAWVIYRGQKHFHALCLLECAIWGSVILSQLAIITVFYLTTYPFLQRLVGLY